MNLNVLVCVLNLYNLKINVFSNFVKFIVFKDLDDSSELGRLSELTGHICVEKNHNPMKRR